MAAHTPTKPPVPKRRIRRRFLLLLIPVIVLVVAWKAVESYVDIEHYRPLIDKELELLIELPLTFGAMDLQLFPTPRLVVENVALGEDDFMAFSPRVTVTADLGKLIHRKLELHAVTIHDLRVQLPEDNAALQDRWRAYMLALETPDPSTGAPMLTVTLEKILGQGAQVFRGEDLYATGNLEVAGVTAGAPVFSFEVDGVGIVGNPVAEGAFTLTVDSEPLLQGTAAVTQLPLANLTGDHAIPPFVLDGKLNYVHAQDGAWTFDASGKVALDDGGGDLGDYSLAARYARGSMHLDSLHVSSQPVEFDGSLALLSDDNWTLDIQSAVLRDQGIDWLADRVPEVPFADNPTVLSEGALTSMRLGEQPGTGFSIEQGTIAVSGADLVLGPLFTLPEVSGLGTVGGNTIEIGSLLSRHVDVHGDVQTDFAADTINVNLSGVLQLAPDLPLPEAMSDAFRPEGGTIGLSEVRASFRSQALDFPALVLDATVENARVSAWDEAAADYVEVPALTGGIAIRDGVFHLDELTGADSMVTATVTPDEALERWAFDGVLQSNLAGPIWKPLFPSAYLSVNGGQLDCTKLSGSIYPATRTLEEVAIEATVRGFDAAIQSDGFEDRLTLDSVTIAGTHDTLAIALDGSSQVLGPVRGQGSVELPAGDVSARVTLNPIRAGRLPAHLKEGLPGRLLAQLSPLPLEINYGSASGLLEFSAIEPIPLSGTLSLRRDGESQSPIAFAAASTLPASWLFDEIPELAAVGTVNVQAQLTPSNGRLEIAAEATNTEVTWGRLQKSPGETLTLVLEGAWEGGPGLDRGRLQLLGQELPFTVGDAGIANEAFSVELAQFAPLLPAGAVLGGAVGGSFSGGLDTIDLELDAVSLQQGADAPVISISGNVRRAGGRWELGELLWAVAGSSGTADLVQRDGTWRGSIHGKQLSLQDLSQAYDSLRQPAEGAVAPPPSETELIAASIAVTADALHLGNVTVQDARCSIESTSESLYIRGFTFVYGEGTGGGRLRYIPGRGGARDGVEAEFQLLQVDAGFIEGLLVEDERGFEGKLDGSAVLSFVVPPRGESYLNHMNGKITFEAVDGTLGKAGLASKLLTSLRTTDVLRLRIPQLRDRGLTFKTLSGEISIDEGVFHLAPYSMADSTYILDADARFDFPADTADGDIQVQVLEGVTGVVGKIPILGEAANLMNKMFSVPIKVTGPAMDPGFRVGMPG